MSTQEKPIGLTQDVGWQIGARRTFDISRDDAWGLLTSDEGVQLWLGAEGNVEFTKGATYTLNDDSAGEIRVFKPGSHLRMTWNPGQWEKASTIQVRVMPATNDRTVIIFHQENLPDAIAREERRDHFIHALDAIGERISSTN